ncbi:hypothetical protein Tsubulata_028452 [Turnera subulata]|uniref:XS domain-containing protein n=1 Tax=Turnera subulata TaxID=218843 RepID=A0A9Q0IYL9_9ROSI|nr:hypothetical protein Tsubulata_028452 [Turnera subulata]
MMDGKSDSFPQLGSVYKRASVIRPVNVAKIAPTTSAQVGNFGVNAWGAKNPAPNPWKGSNLMQKVGLQSNGNTLKSQNGDLKNFPALSSQDGDLKNFPEFNGDLKNFPELSSHQSNNLAAAPQVQSWVNEEVVLKANNPSGDVNVTVVDDDDYSDFDDEIVFDSDEDDVLEYDSDFGDRGLNFEALKRSKWFRAFFSVLDKMSDEEISSSTREWHCPACSGGSGAIDWYRGVHPLMFHAKTKQTRRARLHRIFAETLDEEMHNRGIVIVPEGEVLGKWEGLNGKVKDYEIVWPPMVFILNTRYEQEENGKWTGMGNQELMDHFSSYGAVKARHAYGPQGHRGMSVLIFESSGAGYLEAARLHMHFKHQGRDRVAWDRKRVLFCSGGKRQLYGYLASQEDLDLFNQHCQGRSRLKFEMRSYQEAVESNIKQMSEDCQQLSKLKNGYAREQRQNQALADSVCQLSKKLQKAEKENRIVTHRSNLLHEQHKEEMDALEEFFQDQIKVVHQAIAAKEDEFERLQQEKRNKFLQANGNLSAMQDTNRAEDIASIVKLQDKEMEEFEAERKMLIKGHEEKRTASAKRYWEEQLELEKEFESALTLLLEKYNRNNPGAETSNNHHF